MTHNIAIKQRRISGIALCVSNKSENLIEVKVLLIGEYTEHFLFHITFFFIESRREN